MPTKPTPGPWTMLSGSVYSPDNGRVLLADRNNDLTKPTERDANVRLASFAPELLEIASYMSSRLKFPAGQDEALRQYQIQIRLIELKKQLGLQ